MTGVQGSFLPVALLLTSLVPALVIFTLREQRTRTRVSLNITGAVAKVVLVALLIPPVVAGARFEWRAPLLPGVDLVLVTDTFSLFFVALSAVLWLVTTIYAVGYLENSPNRSRFFGFFSLCVVASTGIALADNLVTFLLFYELLTLVTYPLVAHRGTTTALQSARTYLAYTLTGGVVLLAGVVAMTVLVGPVEFTSGGAQAVADLAAERPVAAIVVFALLIAGLAVKSALVPLHGWLPKAMVAPAPVSALLHAVAVVKAGVFGIVRVVQDLYGIEVSAELGVLTTLTVLGAITIVWGSVRALTQDGLKERLAYSTVSQVSYIVVGITLVSQTAATGGLVHLVHQGFMKITLFLCAGLFMEVLGLSKVSQLAGVGRRMPLTSAAFTVAALGMIGLPPTAGFISKYALGVGALEAGAGWVVPVLVVSTLLNAAYFLPVVYALWFRAPEEGAQWVVPESRRRTVEAPLSLLLPTMLPAAGVLVFGLLAAAPYSPLSIAAAIAAGNFR